MGLIAALMGLHDQEILYFEKALSLNPTDEVIRLNSQRVRNASSEKPFIQPSGERLLLIKAWGYGFWSDVNHVLACLLLAEITGRIPLTHWGGNSLFGDGSGRDAFQVYFEPVSAVALGDLTALKTASFFPDKWSAANILQDECQKWEGAGSQVPSLYFLNRPETVAVSDYHVGVVDLLPWIPQTHELHGNSAAASLRWLAAKYLRPNRSVAAELDAFYRDNLAGRQTIAVHVRGTDKYPEMSDIDPTCQRYFDLIDQDDSSSQIFLLTDDWRYVRLFQQRYGARVAMTDAHRSQDNTGVHHDRSVQPVRRGIEVSKDVYLALRCQKFIGNGESNVAATISMLKEWDKEACTLLAPSRLCRRQVIELHGKLST